MAEEQDALRHLRFATFLAPMMLPIYRAIAATVGEALGTTTELVVERDYRASTDDSNDVCFICSLPYVLAERRGGSPARPIAAPVLIGDRYRGRPIYFSDVIVHRSHPARTFLDLRGASWAYNEPMSQSGYGVTRHHLVTIGETDGFFGEVVQAGFHERAIELVRSRQVEASAIDSHVLEAAMSVDPSLADDVIVVESLGPSTIQPITLTRRVSDPIADRIRAVITSLHERPETREVLTAGRIDHFTAVEASDYDDIRLMLDECERVGFTTLR